MINVAVVLAVVALLRYIAYLRLSPDGKFYLSPDPPRPYCMRLLPRIMPRKPIAWDVLAVSSTAITALLVLYMGGLIAALLWLGLASTRTNVALPVLTDQLGIALLALGLIVPPPYNVAVAVIGAFVNEKVPVFIAALTMSALPIVGLIVPAVAYWRGRKPTDEEPIWLRDPIGEGRKRLVRDGVTNWHSLLVLPWGVALVGLFYVPVIAVVLAYAQILIAQDRARLYQWIGPAVCVAAATVLPAEYVGLLLVAHWANPYRHEV